MNQYDMSIPDHLRRRMMVLDTVSSTNQVAREWAASGAKSGMIVLANFQTGGVGRLGRAWRSPSGSSVLISFIVDLTAAALNPNRLPIAVACALHRCVASTCSIDQRSTSSAFIKWPNDLLLNEKKCAGVLIESVTVNGQARYVVGIGINVLQGEFDSDFRYPATSLTTETGSTINRVDVIDELVASLDSAIEAIGKESDLSGSVTSNWQYWEDLMQYYRKNLFGLNQPVSFLQSTDETEIRGIFRGVSEHGGLLLELDGSQRELWAGDVMHLQYPGRSESRER